MQYSNELDTANLKVAESLEAAADEAEQRRRTSGHLSEIMRGLVIVVESARSHKAARHVLLEKLAAANENNIALSKELRVATAQVCLLSRGFFLIRLDFCSSIIALPKAALLGSLI
jgi:hypothetical protein